MLMDKGSFDCGCEGKVVVVTGGARGIGRNIALAFGRRGARVFIGDADADKGDATVSEMNQQGMVAYFHKCDLAVTGEPQAMIQAVVRLWGRVDVLVNNARSGRRVGLLEMTEENWEAGIAVTLRAAFFASQEAVRSMAQTDGGSIVNLVSIAAQMVCPESPIYHIAKAGMLQMTRYLAVHAGEKRVRVNAILPGFIVQDEHMLRFEAEGNQEYRQVAEFCHPGGYVGSSNDIANAVLFLSSGAARFITGQCLVIDGGSSLREQFDLLQAFRHLKS